MKLAVHFKCSGVWNFDKKCFYFEEKKRLTEKQLIDRLTAGSTHATGLNYKGKQQRSQRRRGHEGIKQTIVLGARLS